MLYCHIGWVLGAKSHFLAQNRSENKLDKVLDQVPATLLVEKGQ